MDNNTITENKNSTRTNRRTDWQLQTLVCHVKELTVQESHRQLQSKFAPVNYVIHHSTVVCLRCFDDVGCVREKHLDYKKFCYNTPGSTWQHSGSMPSKSQKHCYFHSGDVALMLDSKVVHAAIAVLPVNNLLSPVTNTVILQCIDAVNWATTTAFSLIKYHNNDSNKYECAIYRSGTDRLCCTGPADAPFTLTRWQHFFMKWCHGCHLESVTLNWKSDSVNQCHSSKCHQDVILKRAALRRFQRGCPNKNKNHKISSDMRSVPNQKTQKTTLKITKNFAFAHSQRRVERNPAWWVWYHQIKHNSYTLQLHKSKLKPELTFLSQAAAIVAQEAGQGW